MLICPQCQFENPDTNNFCQECGVSLTHKVCHDCGGKVAFNVTNCQECGAAIGTIWWAVIRGQISSKIATLATAPIARIPTVPNIPELIIDPAPSLASAQPESQLSATQLDADTETLTEPKSNGSLDSVATPVIAPQLATEPQSEAQQSNSVLASSPTLTYLDSQHRYQILEVISPVHPSEADALTEVQMRVLDCQPFQVSLLEALFSQKSDTLPTSDATGLESIPIQAEIPVGSNRAIVTSSANGTELPPSLTVPTIAQPYLSLTTQFYQALPAIHDAWEDQGQDVVLLEDRSHLPLLLDSWRDDQTPLPQIIHWLCEMTELWAALEPWCCRQSLLVMTNLRTDEDEIFCLQYLYPDPPSPPLTLKDLGWIWQELFAQSQRTVLGSLSLLLRELQSGVVETLIQLQSRLETIAYAMQDPSSTPESIASASETELALADHNSPSEDAPLNSSHSLTQSSSDPDVTTPPVPADLPLPPTIQMEMSTRDDNGDGDDTPTVVLPMQLMYIEDAGRTDVGRQRDHNEDYFGVQTELMKLESPTGRTLHSRGLYILCDGMGGHAGGEVASALAVDTIKQYFQTHWLQELVTKPDGSKLLTESELPSEASIREAVQLANQAIYDINQKNARSGSGRMGTTLVLLLTQGNQIAVAHVGDSRLYSLSRRKGLEQVTTDHDVGQREIQRGVEPSIAYARPDSYQLTQALGPRDEHFVNPDVQFLEMNEDTLLLLCSDGLADNDLLETHWRTHLEPLLSSQANLERGVAQLIDLANQYNGHDNITALAIRMKVRPNLESLKPK